MKNIFLPFLFLGLAITGCKKAGDDFAPAEIPSYKIYKIKMGEHYADQNVPVNLETSMLKFSVKFDSSAIYTTVLPENQYDINKLYGFSDNDANHHQYSARIGWRWSENALRLFAYVYNAGELIAKEITSVSLGSEVQCSITISTVHYIFKVNEVTELMPRAAATVKAKGYRLYPYFGGDETAPHDITISIRDEKQQ